MDRKNTNTREMRKNNHYALIVSLESLKKYIWIWQLGLHLNQYSYQIMASRNTKISHLPSPVYSKHTAVGEMQNIEL